MYINTKVIFEWNPELQKYVETYTEGYEYDGEMMMASILDFLGEAANTSAGDLIRGAGTYLRENWPNYQERRAELERKRAEGRPGDEFKNYDESEYLPAGSEFHTELGPYEEGDPPIREYNGKQYFAIKDANGDFTWHPGSKGMYYDKETKKFVDKEGAPVSPGKDHVGAGPSAGPGATAGATAGSGATTAVAGGGTNGFASGFKPGGGKPWMPTSPKPIIDTETGDLVGGEPEEYMGVTKRQWELLGGVGANAAGKGIAAIVGGGKKAGNSLIDWVEKRKRNKEYEFHTKNFRQAMEEKKNQTAGGAPAPTGGPPPMGPPITGGPPPTGPLPGGPPIQGPPPPAAAGGAPASLRKRRADRDYVKEEYGWTPEIGEKNRQALERERDSRALEQADRDYVKKEYGWTPEIGEENRQALEQKKVDRELEEKAIQQKEKRQNQYSRDRDLYNTYGTNNLDKIKQFNEAAGKHTGGDVDEFMKQYRAGIGIARLDPSTGVSNSILDNKGQDSIGTSYKVKNLQDFNRTKNYSLKTDPKYPPLREKILEWGEKQRGDALKKQYSHLLEPEDEEYDISGDTPGFKSGKYWIKGTGYVDVGSPEHKAHLASYKEQSALGGALGVATDQSLHDNIFKTHAGFTEKTMQKTRDLRKAFTGLDPTGKYTDVKPDPMGGWNSPGAKKAHLMRKAQRIVDGTKWYQKQNYNYDWK